MGVTIECDLRHMFGPVRDQGARPTCMAFAACDAHAAVRPDWVPLSCEYAYFHAVQRDGGGPDDGATLGGMLAAIRDDGQPQEEGWPYLPQVPAEIALWKPPANAGLLYRRAGERGRAAPDAVLRLLDAGVPVIVTMYLSDAFYRPDADGIIAADEPSDPERRHAVIAVGHGQHDGQKLVLIRNSWGRLWGIDGYGWVSEGYLGPRIYGIAEMKEDLTNVSADRNATNVRSGVA